MLKRFSCTSLKLVALVVAILVGTLDMAAQNINVKGVVKDTNGEPIIGAGVQVVGTKAGVATEVDGSYTISAPKNGTLKRG